MVAPTNNMVAYLLWLCQQSLVAHLTIILLQVINMVEQTVMSIIYGCAKHNMVAHLLWLRKQSLVVHLTIILLRIINMVEQTVVSIIYGCAKRSFALCVASFVVH
jgi:hypothetical protein